MGARVNVEPACLTSFHARAALMGFAFALIAGSGGAPITPELYGERVYAIPAEVWGVAQVALGAGCALAIIGQRMVVLALLSGLSALFYCALGTLAMRAEMGTLVAIGSIAIMMPPCISTFLYATARIGGRNG